MSRRAGKAYHPSNGAPVEIWEGFSWPCLFLGFIWYVFKGLWGWALIALILALSTFGLSWLVFPFFANGQHAKALMERGYLTEVQWQERQQPKTPRSVAQPAASLADELTKLANLKAAGHLSQAEFDAQKARLLAKA